jgi:hypothetical protein
VDRLIKKIAIVLSLTLILFSAITDIAYSQDMKNAGETDAVQSESGDDGFDDFDFDEEVPAVSETEASDSRRSDILLQRELKRHENEIKKIKLVKSRAREVLRKCEEDEAKELKRHYEAVRELKGN